MTALADIRDVLNRAKRPARYAERTILLGDSAYRAVCAELDIRNVEKIDGVVWMSSGEFQGWEIRDVDHLGVWRDVRVA